MCPTSTGLECKEEEFNVFLLLNPLIMQLPNFVNAYLKSLKSITIYGVLFALAHVVFFNNRQLELVSIAFLVKTFFLAFFLFLVAMLILYGLIYFFLFLHKKNN